MVIQTKFHGEINIKESELITFKDGIPGFPEEHKYTILPLEEDETFLILQSIKNPEIAFVIINPFHYFPDYDFTIEDSVVEKLEIEDTENILVYSILTVQDPFKNTTANLQAPVIVNIKNRLGKQVIINDNKYTTRHKILGKG